MFLSRSYKNTALFLYRKLKKQAVLTEAVCVVPSFLNIKLNAFPHSKFKGFVYVHENKLNSTCHSVTEKMMLRLQRKQMHFSVYVFALADASGKILNFKMSGMRK